MFDSTLGQKEGMHRVDIVHFDLKIEGQVRQLVEAVKLDGRLLYVREAENQGRPELVYRIIQ